MMNENQNGFVYGYQFFDQLIIINMAGKNDRVPSFFPAIYWSLRNLQFFFLIGDISG